MAVSFALFFLVKGRKMVSTITGKYYDESKAVPFSNLKQAYAYMERGVIPIDVFAGNKKIVFVFSREDHDRLKMVWRKPIGEKSEINEA